MKLCRFDEDRLGLVRGDLVHDVTAVLEALPAVRWPMPRHDRLVANLPALRAAIELQAERGTPLPLDGRVLRAPVANAGKVVAVRRNYRPGPAGTADLFLKAASSIVGPGEGIRFTMPDRACRHEIELAVVIGATATAVDAGCAMDCVAGYCIGLDMTSSGEEDRGLRKSADSFTVLGPWLTTVDEVPDPAALDVELAIGGHSRQRGCTRDLLLGTAELIAAASRLVTLCPGDVLLTGSPPGAAPVADGDLLDCSISRLGAMRVTVRGPA